MKARMVRVHQQLRLVEDQISILATEKREQLKQVDNAKMRQVALEASGDRSGEFLGLRHGVFWVAPVSQPTGGGRPGGADAHPL